MPFVDVRRPERTVSGVSIWQGLAAAYCVLFGLAIIVNVQLGGEAMWFWYASLFHQGAKLYSDLHAVFQPLYVLETNAWMRVTGIRCIPYEGLAVVHLLVLCGAMLLLLRESAWPDWQKAIVMFGVFLMIIRFTAYRFDDFHVVADTLYLLGALLLLWLERAVTRRNQLIAAGLVGLVCGLAVANRLTDGGMLLIACVVALPLMARQGKLNAFAVFAAATALTFFALIALTGDGWQAYVTNSVLRASGAKGGTSSVLHGPVAALADSVRRLIHGPKQPTLVLIFVVLLGAILYRYWRRDARLIIAIQVAVTLLLACFPSISGELHFLLKGLLIDNVSTSVQPLTYLLCLIVMARALRSRFGAQPRPVWDPREAVILVPVGTLLSAALSQGNSTSNSTITMALLFLLVPSFLAGDQNGWFRASFLSLLVLAGATGSFYKFEIPYNWGSAQEKPMFSDRVLYHHPIYGLMYVDRSVLQFNEATCAHIAAGSGASEQGHQLFSMPFPYANYFCGIAPWHRHVQMWYDTVSAATVHDVMQELATAPPGWILYQRSTATIKAHEDEYNHHHPIAHRLLDQEIVDEVHAGKWHVVQETHFVPGEAWYLIHTQP